MGHAAQDGTRIESAAQGCPNRDVAPHADAAGVQEQFAEALHLIVVFLRDSFKMIERTPPAANLRRLAHTKREAVTAQEMIQAFQHATLVAFDEAFVGQCQGDHARIKFGFEPIEGEESFHLGGERKMVFIVMIDHRFDAEAVA